MKTRDKKHTVAVQDLESFSFTAEMNAEMFDLLINKMYSDKIAAVIRELGANAVDSHIMANNFSPFSVHLPTPQEPYFSLRDFGVGLNRHGIETLYTRLGASSKRETNDQIGCIGIGSKSPFAYTTTFTITSYKDGVRYSYCAYIDNDKMPKVAVFDEDRPTDEPNGLEIKFNVDKFDINEFTNKAKEIYEFYAVKPNIATNQTKYMIGFETGKIRIRDGNYNSYSAYSRITGIPRIIMGGIKYNFDKSFFDSKMRDMPLDLFFDIGELSVAGNREDISYDNDTIEIIKKKLNEAETFISQQISENIKGAKCLYDAHEMSQAYASFNVPLLFKGQKIPYRLSHVCDFRFIEYGTFKNDYKPGNTYSVHNRPKFVVNDLNIGAISRVEHAHKTNGGNYVLLFADDKQKKEFQTSIGLLDSHFIKASSLPKPPPKKSAKTEGQSYLYQTYKKPVWYRQNHERLFNYWKAESVPDNTQVYYVKYDRGRFLYGDQRIHPEHVHDMMVLLNISKVYGISKVLLEELEADGFNGVEVTSLMKNFKPKTKFLNVQNFDNGDYIRYERELKPIRQYSKTINKFLTDAKNATVTETEIIKSLKNSYQIFGIKEPNVDAVNPHHEYNELKNKFPLAFNSIHKISNNTVKDHIQKYFQFLGE